MSSLMHNELKKEFQLERFILFSDAVFAIAITLLVIEIKIPEIHKDVSDAVLLQSLKSLIPKFAGFFISFMLIGMYWTVHHRMFGFVINYNRRLLWINLIFLFFIALMPFSTGFYSEYAGKELVDKQIKVPMTFYVLNFCGAGFMHYFMWRYITNPKNNLIDAAHTKVQSIREAKTRSLIVPIIFLSMLPAAYFINVLVAVYIPLFIPIIMRVLRRRWKKEIESL
jgi:uncharacterized membrane protein